SFLSPALASIMAKMGMPASMINYFIGIHNFLAKEARGSLFTSFSLGNPAPPGTKLDYAVIPIKTAKELIDSLGIGGEFQGKLEHFAEILDMKNITYLGIKYITGKQFPLLKVYFDRRFSSNNEDSAGVLADFLTGSYWRL
ncbi:MAG: hypothetical protein ACLFQV_06430, partial [Vulcanimicrobiota bacterium]